MTTHSRPRTYARSSRLLVILFFLSTFLAGPALQADQDTAVRGAASMYQILANRGYATLRHEDSDVLGQGEIMSYTVTLYRGVTYILFAAGDQNIGDLDINLFDENGNFITGDEARDDRPVVSVTPRWTGPFKVQVKNYRGTRGWYHFAIAN